MAAGSRSDGGPGSRVLLILLLAYIFNFIDRQIIGTTTRITGLFQNGYALFDARLVYETHDRRYSIGVYANNLFDRTYKTDGQEFSSIGSIRTVYYGAPRTFFVRAGVHF